MKKKELLLQKKLSPRLEHLLADLDSQSKRTRFIIISLLVLLSLSLLTNLNEKSPAGNLARADIRMINLALHNKDNPTNETSHDKGHFVSEQYILKDKDELHYIRRLQIMSLEGIEVPVLGIKISAANAGLIAVIFGIILYGWLLFSMEKEQSTIAHILFPLVAKKHRNIARTLWNGGGDKLDDVVDYYQAEVYRIREAISSSFLFIYADDRTPKYEKYASIMILLPAFVLAIHVALDFLWDMKRSFPEGGKNMTYIGELNDKAATLCMNLDTLVKERSELNYSYCFLAKEVLESPDLLKEYDIDLKQEINRTARAILLLKEHSIAIYIIRLIEGISVLIVLYLACKAYKKVRRTSQVLTYCYSDADSNLSEFIEDKIDVPYKNK